MSSSVQKGRYFEQVAASYLAKQGLKIFHRNYRCRYGEIDLIARDFDTVCFVEVRSRESASFMSPLDSITATKQSRLIRTAQHYLQRSAYAGPCRFDLVLVVSGRSQSGVEWLRDAFQAAGNFVS